MDKIEIEKIEKFKIIDAKTGKVIFDSDVNIPTITTISEEININKKIYPTINQKDYANIKSKLTPKNIINIIEMNGIKLNFYQKLFIYMNWYKYRAKEVIK